MNKLISIQTVMSVLGLIIERFKFRRSNVNTCLSYQIEPYLLGS